MRGEGDSVSVVTLPAPPVLMTTTTTVKNNTDIIFLPLLQEQMNDTYNLLDVGIDNGVSVVVGVGVVVGVVVGNMEDVVELEGTLHHPSGLH